MNVARPTIALKSMLFWGPVLEYNFRSENRTNERCRPCWGQVFTSSTCTRNSSWSDCYSVTLLRIDGLRVGGGRHFTAGRDSSATLSVMTEHRKNWQVWIIFKTYKFFGVWFWCPISVYVLLIWGLKVGSKNHHKWDPQIGLLLYFLKDAKKGRQK